LEDILTPKRKKMKKVLLVAFVAGLAMTSCKKEWTCECTVTLYTNGASTSTTVSGKTDKMSKKDAKDKCKSSTTGDTQNGTKSTCDIK
jgi:hypothetical protein